MLTRDDILQILLDNKERFAEKYGVTKLGLFGSFARNEATEESDVDVCVEMPPVFSTLKRCGKNLNYRVKGVSILYDYVQIYENCSKNV